MSALLGVLRSADEALQEFLIQQVTALVALLKAHMRKWLADILDVIGSFWAITSSLLPGLLRLLSELAGESCPKHLSLPDTCPDPGLMARVSGLWLRSTIYKCPHSKRFSMWHSLCSGPERRHEGILAQPAAQIRGAIWRGGARRRL